MKGFQGRCGRQLERNLYYMNTGIFVFIFQGCRTFHPHRLFSLRVFDFA